MGDQVATSDCACSILFKILLFKPDVRLSNVTLSAKNGGNSSYEKLLYYIVTMHSVEFLGIKVRHLHENVH